MVEGEAIIWEVVLTIEAKFCDREAVIFATAAAPLGIWYPEEGNAVVATAADDDAEWEPGLEATDTFDEKELAGLPVFDVTKFKAPWEDCLENNVTPPTFSLTPAIWKLLI